MKIAKMILLAAVAPATLIWGQVVGASISGTVRDESGAGLPAAAVSVKNVETGSEVSDLALAIERHDFGPRFLEILG